MKDYPIKLGSMLFTMVEPHAGREVEYNRWYERDHFYAGCMVGPYNFSGARFVATKPLKELRFPEESPITSHNMIGSYLALYWILAGHHSDWNRWAVDQVNWLHANDRMFAERDHIHTLLYDLEWSALRHPDGPSAELALDHRYPGLAVVFGEAAQGVERGQVSDWYRRRYLPAVMAGSPIGLCLSFSPLPLLIDAPGDVPRSGPDDSRFLHLYFMDTNPAEVWESFKTQAKELDKSGLGRILWASPFIPTLPGTDTYADQLH